LAPCHDVDIFNVVKVASSAEGLLGSNRSDRRERDFSCGGGGGEENSKNER
jgi:hypothetical protein